MIIEVKPFVYSSQCPMNFEGFFSLAGGEQALFPACVSSETVPSNSFG